MCVRACVCLNRGFNLKPFLPPQRGKIIAWFKIHKAQTVNHEKPPSHFFLPADKFLPLHHRVTVSCVPKEIYYACQSKEYSPYCSPRFILLSRIGIRLPSLFGVWLFSTRALAALGGRLKSRWLRYFLCPGA